MSYPEHEKLEAVSEDSQTVGAFLDTCGYTLCRVVHAGDNGEPRFIDAETGEPSDKGGLLTEWNPAYESWADHYAPAGKIEDVLAAHYGIDLAAIEREKRAMLDAIRAQNRAA